MWCRCQRLCWLWLQLHCRLWLRLSLFLNWHWKLLWRTWLACWLLTFRLLISCFLDKCIDFFIKRWHIVYFFIKLVLMVLLRVKSTWMLVSENFLDFILGIFGLSLALDSSMLSIPGFPFLLRVHFLCKDSLLLNLESFTLGISLPHLMLMSSHLSFKSLIF